MAIAGMLKENHMSVDNAKRTIQMMLEEESQERLHEFLTRYFEIYVWATKAEMRRAFRRAVVRWGLEKYRLSFTEGDYNLATGGRFQSVLGKRSRENREYLMKRIREKGEDDANLVDGFYLVADGGVG